MSLAAGRNPSADGPFADRASTAFPRSNHQIRVRFSSVAYLLSQALRRLDLNATEPAQVTYKTFCPNPLTMEALIRVTAREVPLSPGGRLSPR